MKKKSSAACLYLCLISLSLGERSISDSQEEEIDRSTAFLSLALGYRSVGSSREEGIHCSNFSLNSLDCMLHIIFSRLFSPSVCVCVCVSLSLSLSETRTKIKFQALTKDQEEMDCSEVPLHQVHATSIFLVSYRNAQSQQELHSNCLPR